MSGRGSSSCGGVPASAKSYFRSRLSSLVSRPSSSGLHTLELEQPHLPPQSAAIAAELATGVHHAMTGDHDRVPILAIRAAHGAHRFRVVHRSGKVGIGAGDAVGNLAERIPYRELKWRTAQHQ